MFSTSAIAVALRLALLASLQEAPPIRQDPPPKIAELSIEDILKLEVTIVSRREQPLMDAAAAVYVIRGEDIHRAGMTTIAEALRMVPGVQVARINSNTWAISARGFNSRWANKLQVLIDGQSMFEPAFGGVAWDILDTNLEDIDRIEVIRGPGGTLWGSNALNGVVNIMTKMARDTQGFSATAGGGSLEQDFASFRFGGKEGENFHYRVYAKYFNRGSFGEGRDDWFQARAGFRADWSAGTDDLITFRGNLYHGYSRTRQVQVSLTPPSTNVIASSGDMLGGGFFARWERTLAEGSSLKTQLTYRRNDRDREVLRMRQDTIDLDFQHRLPIGQAHDLVWGLGYRLIDDHQGGTFTIQFNPEDSRHDVVSAFLQDEIMLADGLRFTLGSKFEHNDFSGFEFQPNVRIAWRAAERHSLWAAVSRAVRAPARADDDFRFNAFAFPGSAPPFNPTLGSIILKEVPTEHVHALELGYRVQPLDTLSLDTAVFYNQYHDLGATSTRFISNETDPPPTHDTLASFVENAMNGATYGIEIASTWRPLPEWTLQGSYSHLVMHLDADSSEFEASEDAEGSSPRGQAYLRTSFSPAGDFAVDVIARYVSRLSNLDIDGYMEMDARVGWNISPQVELFLVGQNLLRTSHPEFKDAFDPSDEVEIERSVHVGLTAKF